MKVKDLKNSSWILYSVIMVKETVLYIMCCVLLRKLPFTIKKYKQKNTLSKQTFC